MRAEGSTRNHPSWITVLTLTALLVLGITGVQAASAAETVTMEVFCKHAHYWGGSSTTFPKGIYHACQPSSAPLIHAVFCPHVHGFAANNTTTPSNLKARQWCEENSSDPATQVPAKVYCYHLHENASSNTTYPHPDCS